VILLLRKDAPADSVRALDDRIRAMGLTTVTLDDAKGRAIEVLGDDRGQALAMADDPAVEEILTRRRPLVGGEPIWPHFALRLGMLAVAVISAVLLLAAFLPPGLGDPASHPLASKPPVEWYLRPPTFLIEALPASLRWLGGTLVFLFGAAFIALPWIDGGDLSTPRGRAVARAVRAVGALVFLISLVLVLGVLS
jgi:quinol-cytochrome oxidoreductase complex cytochrome b subunit